jgi:hypothetical protein
MSPSLVDEGEEDDRLNLQEKLDAHYDAVVAEAFSS